MDEPHLYLMRIWQDKGRFQVSLRGADEQEPRLFSALEQLTEFLATVVTPEADPAQSRPTDTGESA